MRIQSNKSKLYVALAGLGIFMASGAWAHPRLRKSIPAQGSVVSVAPKKVFLRFSENLEPAFSRVEVKQLGSKKVVSEGKGKLVKGQKNALEVPLKQPLESGKYEVLWRATSVDTHHLTGHFEFTYQSK